MRGAIAAIGIVKGQPFAPDERMKTLLTEAATLGDATSRAITYHPRFDGVKIYPDDPNSVWSTAFANKNTSFEADGTMGLDARVLYYFNAGGVTPAMATTHAGEGSDYALALLDANKQAFDGAKTYKLHLPKDVPVNDFWAVTIYDTQTRSQLQTSQHSRPSAARPKGMTAERDGPTTSTSRPKRPRARKATGCRPSRARAGSPSCACMARWSPGSTRPGGPARSNWCNEALHDQDRIDP